MGEKTLAALLVRMFRDRTAERTPPRTKVCEVWSEIFRCSQDSREFLLFLDGVRWIITEVQKQVDALPLPEAAADRYRGYLGELKVFTNLDAFGSEWRALAVHHLTERHIEALIFLDAHLAPRFSNQRTNGRLMDDFRKDLDELTEDLPLLDVSDDLKKIIRAHLKSIIFIFDNL
jgi:hypothetical protein